MSKQWQIVNYTTAISLYAKGFKIALSHKNYNENKIVKEYQINEKMTFGELKNIKVSMYDLLYGQWYIYID